MKKSSVFDALKADHSLEAHISKSSDGLWVASIVDPHHKLVRTFGVQYSEHAAIEWGKKCIANIRDGLEEPADLYSRLH